VLFRSIKHDYKGLKAYVDSLPKNHPDRNDLLTAVSHMVFGNEKHLAKHIEKLDTDVADKVEEYMMKEEADQTNLGGGKGPIGGKYGMPTGTTNRVTQAMAAAKFAKQKKQARLNRLTKEEVEHIDEANSYSEVAKLKSEGKHREAGKRAKEAGHPRQYGVHFGMRSGIKKAKDDFYQGYDSVNEDVELDEAKCNMTEAGSICEIHGKQNCSNEETENPEDKNPKYTGKKNKIGKQLLVDKMKKYISEIRRV
jgi:hypothetical protein